MRTIENILFAAVKGRFINDSRHFKPFRLPRKIKKKFKAFVRQPMYKAVYNQELYDYYKYYSKNE